MARRKSLPWVMPSSCEGCSTCVTVCKKGCLEMRPDGEQQDVFIPWIENVDKCSGCALCADACVWGAIAMTANMADAEKRFRTYFQDRERSLSMDM